MKKILLTALLCVLTVFSFSCSGGDSWKGFYDEDLGKYLTLADYKTFKYEIPKVEVTEPEVDERIALLLEAASEVSEVDKPFATEMTVSFDRYCFIGGVAVPELSEEGGIYTLGEELYEDEAVALLLPMLIGMKKGETASLDITLPAGYHSSEGGENATYNITVLAVYEKKTPALTDALAPKLIAGCNTVSELRAEILRRLTRDKEKEAETKTVAALRKELIDKSTLLSAPYSLYQDYYEDRLYLYEKLADAASMTLSEYLEKCTDMTLNELELALSEAANADVKEILVLYSVVKRENISSTKEEISAFAEKMAGESEGVFESGEEYLSYYGINAVTVEYLWSEVMEIVVSSAVA